jgi:hypothetical protein
MKFDTGTIITGVAMLIFYLRLMQIRGHKLKLARQAGKPGQTKGGKEKGSKKGKQADAKYTSPKKVSFQITSWWLVALGIIFMSAGLAMKTSSGWFSGWLPATYMDYWWIGTSLGALVFMFCFK